MHTTWRFYREEGGEWKWQQVGVGHEVLAESRSSFTSYDEAVADAKKKGYVFAAAQERTRSGAMRSGTPTVPEKPEDVPKGRKRT